MIAYIFNGVINKPARDALLLDHALREFSSKETAISSSDEVNEPCYDLLISQLVRLHWDWAHMLRVKESYVARYQRSMEEDIKNATEGDFSAFCLSLVGSGSKENPVDDNATGSVVEPYQLAGHARSQKEPVAKIGSTPFAPEDGTVISGIEETGDQLATKNADSRASTVTAEQQSILPDKPLDMIDVISKRRWQPLVFDSDNSPPKPRSHGDISGITLGESENCFICNYGGCHESFSRRYDLQRHHEVHSPLHTYWCRAQGCKRNEAVIGAKPFPRKDKRNEHERKVHHEVEAPQLDDGAATSEASWRRTSHRNSPITRPSDLGDEYYSYTDVAGKRSARGFDIIDRGVARSINYGAYRDADLYAVPLRLFTVCYCHPILTIY